MRIDFEARVSMIGERHVCVGYRPQFHYPCEKHGYCIVPLTWFTLDGIPIPQGEVPADFLAGMTILNDDLRQSVHRQRIHAGTQFEWKEGYRLVARGEVARLVDLHLEVPET